jgi:IS5 family transposase
MAMLLRGYLGEGFKARDTRSLQAESITLRTMFANMGVRQPRPGTLTELVNAVSIATRERVLTAQLAYALELKLDDFETMIADSTHVRGNTAWPTDSRLMVAICERLLRVGASLPELGLSAIQVPCADKHVATMRQLDREIGLSKGKQRQDRPRRRRYAKMITRARKVHDLLDGPITASQRALDALDIAPSRKQLAQRAMSQLAADLQTLTTVTDNCHSRVLDGESVPMRDKVLSVSDPDAAYIAKGQREAVIGYKPQIARSRTGFITSLKVPRGNAPDSQQLLDLVDDTTTRTGVKLRVVSVDDGYASAANVEALTERNVDIVAINGAKGRKLTTDEQWDSDEHTHARNVRSAVESLMYTLKQGFNFDEVARRGLDAAHAELLEKALAHNLCNLLRVRDKKQRLTVALAA